MKTEKQLLEEHDMLKTFLQVTLKLPLMKTAYDKGKMVRFTRGKLLVDGRVILVV